MEQWLAQTPLNKLIDIALLLITFLVIIGTLNMFITSLFKKNKNIDIKTPVGSIKTSDQNEKREEKSNVNVNFIQHSPSKGLVLDSVPDGILPNKDDACDDGLERYEPPKGIPSFKEHKFFKLMAKALHGRVIKLKSRHAPTEFQDIKNKVFSYFLFECKTKVFDEMIEDFVDDCLCQFGNRQLIASIIRRTMKAIEQYEDKARNAKVVIDDNTVLLGIPEIMITKFNEWHQNHVNITLDKLETIIESQFYPSWQLKLISILDTFETIFSVTFDYAEYSLVDLNGELDEALKNNIVYRKKE